MSAVPKLRFPEFDGEWQDCSLNSIVSMKSGKFISAAEILEAYEKGTYPCYGGNGIRGYVRTYNHNGKYVLIGRQGALCGNVLLVNGEFYATEHAVVTEARSGNDISWLQFQLDRMNLNQYSTGLAQPGLSVSNLNELRSLVPSLPEQQKIASFLSSVDKKIDLLRQKKDALETYKKGLMQKIFSQEIRFKQDDGSDFPDWEEVALGEHTSVIMGQSPSSEGYNDEGLGLPLIQGNADIKNRFTSPQRYTSVCSKTAEAGDIIMCVRAPIGLVSVCTEISCLGRGVAALRAKSSLRQNFLFQFLIMFEDRWVRIGQGSTFTAINGADIKGLEFPLPCPDEQQKIASLLSLLDVKIGTVSSQIEQMETFKKGLLQQMFV